MNVSIHPAARLGAAALLALATMTASHSATIAPAQPKATTLIATLASPWGLAFLPDGRMLVTQKGGSMVILAPDGNSVQATVSGLPAVAAGGQGGLLDVALDPDFAKDPWIYWTYSEPGTGAETGLIGTAVARGRLVGTALQDVAVVYRQVPKVTGEGHYGSRIAFRGDGTMFVTLGERQKGSPAQDLATTLGKVVRLNRDGSLPADNPAIPGARPEIWSYGHRNPQGAAMRPGTDVLWLNEHGPQGGDELNRIVPGGNYGWPLVSYGCNYGAPVGDACRIGGGTHAPLYVEPVSYWVPVSIAPAGLVFYTADGFPQWKGNALMGALAGTALWRIELDGDKEASRERLFGTLGERIRDVEQGPDGWLYLLTDSGKLLRVSQDVFAITTTASPTEGGSVTCTPNPVALGGSATCTATPGTGYVFESFAGDCTGSTCALENVTTARSVTATFIPATSIPRLVNLSTRGAVGTGEGVMIGGFAIAGAAPKKVLITARGQSLANVGVVGAMANPKIELFAGQAKLLDNDDWQNQTAAAGGAAAVAEITATGIFPNGLAPSNPLESALMVTLNPGAYTAIVSGADDGTGVGIVEVFEESGPDIPLINISTRGQVQTGSNVMIGGFVIQGDGPKTVLITARGPSLADYGITNPLANPVLQLFSGQVVIASNDDWQQNANAGDIAALGIFPTGLAPSSPLEAALLVTLNPGAYTAIVSGMNGGTGVGIVEVFAR